MAQHWRLIKGDPKKFFGLLDDRLSRAISCKVEHNTAHSIGDAQMYVRTYERYSMAGGNRVSLNVAVLVVGDQMVVDMTAAGGSEAVLFKINTFGEEAFLNEAVAALDTYESSTKGGGGR